MKRVFMLGYSDHKGGVETYIDNLCSKLNKTEYDVVYSMPIMTIDGKIWIKPKNRHNFIKYFVFWKKFFKANKFDVIYYNACDIVSIDILKFAKAAGVPVRIIHSHSTGIQQGLNLFHRLSEKINHRLLDKYANCFFACSQEAGKWMFGDKKFKIIKNGVNLDKYEYSVQKSNKCREQIGVKDCKLVGMVGRISKVKNPRFAIEIAKELFSRNDQLRFIFIGDGELMATVKQIVKEEKLENRILFLGTVDNVDEWLSALDCLIMPSLFEGLPFVLVEAQASSLPCVVSDNVTRDADITGLVHFLSLEDGPKKWADTIINETNKHRADTKKTIVDSGYSSNCTVKCVMDTIDNLLNERSI